MKKILLISSTLLLLPMCNTDDSVNYTEVTPEVSTHPNDVYAKEHFLSLYNTRVIWKRDRIYTDVNKYVTPTKEDLVIPVMKMVENFWIEPFQEVSGGDKLLKQLFPDEFVFIGSPMYNDDGTITLGFAEGGTRITLTDLDRFNLKDSDWLRQQLHTMHHEFTHIVHQSYSLPDGWKDLSPTRTGNAWINYSDPVDDPENKIIKMGFVSAYGSSQAQEDFADYVGRFLTTPKEEFESLYLTKVDTSGITDYDTLVEIQEYNEGIVILQKKYKSVVDYYQSKFGIDIVKLRDIIEARIKAAG